jgi:hypothetical protein
VRTSPSLLPPFLEQCLNAARSPDSPRLRQTKEACSQPFSFEGGSPIDWDRLDLVAFSSLSDSGTICYSLRLFEDAGVYKELFALLLHGGVFEHHTPGLRQGVIFIQQFLGNWVGAFEGTCYQCTVVPA